jgi:hypothetical protein
MVAGHPSAPANRTAADYGLLRTLPDIEIAKQLDVSKTTIYSAAKRWAFQPGRVPICPKCSRRRA